MVTKTYQKRTPLPTYICDSSEGSYSSNNSDSCDSRDQKTFFFSPKNLFSQKSFIHKMFLFLQQTFSPKNFIHQKTFFTTYFSSLIFSTSFFFIKLVEPKTYFYNNKKLCQKINSTKKLKNSNCDQTEVVKKLQK